MKNQEPSINILRIQSFTAKQEPILSVTQFANEARVTPQAVRKMIAEKRIRATKIGKQHSIPNEELVRYLQTIG